MIWSPEHQDRIVFALPKIADQHAAFAAGCLYDLAFADVDPDVVYLLPAVTTFTLFVDPEHEIAGLEFASTYGESTIITVLGLTCSVEIGRAHV